MLTGLSGNAPAVCAPAVKPKDDKAAATKAVKPKRRVMREGFMFTEVKLEGFIFFMSVFC
jgi:hypothetical protein